jgi:uncharacterized secreted protein with C-terminal beta-propeller domain
MAYVVTFKKTDPLFAIDLSQPLEPKMLGELKVPGFSVYMHQISRKNPVSQLSRKIIYGDSTC